MPSTTDPVGLALASLGAGSSAGASVITAGTIVLRSVQRAEAEPNLDTGFVIMSVVLVVGIATAVTTGITLTRALDETWRRGVVGALSVFGTALLAGLAAPADMLAGRSGLGVYLIALILLAIAMWRSALRSASR